MSRHQCLILGLLFLACAPLGAQRDDPGAEVYARKCRVCHLDDGSGLPPIGLALGDNPNVTGEAAELVRYIMTGQSAFRPEPSQRRSLKMPKFDSLSDEQIAAVATYIRENFGNSAPEVSPSVVAEVRANP